MPGEPMLLCLYGFFLRFLFHFVLFLHGHLKHLKLLVLHFQEFLVGGSGVRVDDAARQEELFLQNEILNQSLVP